MLSGSCFGGRVFVCLFAWVDGGGGALFCFTVSTIPAPTSGLATLKGLLHTERLSRPCGLKK